MPFQQVTTNDFGREPPRSVKSEAKDLAIAIPSRWDKGMKCKLEIQPQSLARVRVHPYF
ncbi:MAG TPA: hypothetical protein V6D09_16125 [Leptolyngbyaceae cyanobacterium]